MTGMQAARLKAESQDRKAKVYLVTSSVLPLGLLLLGDVGYPELIFCATACQLVP